MIISMKKAGILGIVAALTLIGACAEKQSSEPESDAASGAEATTTETGSTESYPQKELPLEGAPAAPPGPLACVKDMPPDAICTMDLNQCGHSGSCNCGPGYIYNASMGKCLLIMDGVAEAVKPDVADDDCVKAATGSCTKDINVCGQPSTCKCEDGFQWNAVAGKCVKS
jgi:hypothetical protein